MLAILCFAFLVYLYVYLFVCLFVCLFVRSFVCLFACLLACLFVYGFSFCLFFPTKSTYDIVKLIKWLLKNVQYDDRIIHILALLTMHVVSHM